MSLHLVENSTQGIIIDMAIALDREAAISVARDAWLQSRADVKQPISFDYAFNLKAI